MDATALGMAHRFAGPIDIGVDGPRETGDGRLLHALGDRRHRLEVAFGCDREAGLDDVDAHGVEAIRNLELLLEGHGRTGALLAVAQRGVENHDPVVCGRTGHRAGLGLDGLRHLTSYPSSKARAPPTARRWSWR